MFSKYIMILIWIGVVALFQYKFYRVENIGGKEEWRLSPVFAFVVFLPVIWMVANRSPWEGDTNLYIQNFMTIPDSILEIESYLSDITKDKGFYVLSVLIKTFVHNRTVWYFAVIALIQGVLLVRLYRKYSSEYVFSIFLFVASTDYHSWMFNGIRQFTAVTLTLIAAEIILENQFDGRIGKYIKAGIIILIASTVHGTAVLMIPLLYIAQGKAWNKKTLLFMAATILIIAFVGRFTNILDTVLKDTQYTNVVTDYTSEGDDGTNPIRVLIYSIPAFLAFLGRRTIAAADDRVINFCANMSVMTAGLYLVSMVTSGIYMGRLPIYCSLFNYILLPWEINNIFRGSNRNIIKIAAIVGYLGFYYYQMHIAWSYI